MNGDLESIVQSEVLGDGADEPSRQPLVSVIIAAYTEERWDSMVKCVCSALDQSPPPLEVVLAIDHNPGLADRARQHFDGVVVVESTNLRGASGTRNSGVAASRGELLVFLDDDQAATPGWLASIASYFADPDVLGVGGGITLSWPQSRPRWFPGEFDWVVGGSYTGMPVVASPIRNVWSGNMAIRRKTFDAAGGFRAGFGKLGMSSRPEDTDLCLRVVRLHPSGHWLYAPDAEVVHLVPARRSTRRFFLGRCWSEGRGKGALIIMNGAGVSTELERRYTTRVLPGALARALGRGVLRADVGSLERAVAILCGVLLTATGVLAEYAVVTVASVWSRERGGSRGEQSGSVPVTDGEGAVPVLPPHSMRGV